MLRAVHEPSEGAAAASYEEAFDLLLPNWKVHRPLKKQPLKASAGHTPKGEHTHPRGLICPAL